MDACPQNSPDKARATGRRARLPRPPRLLPLLTLLVALPLFAPARAALAEAPPKPGGARSAPAGSSSLGGPSSGPSSRGASRSEEAEAAVIAEALFRDAMTLMDAQKYADACPKLEESQRLAPGLGTRFHLGNCYEKLGRRATAWSTFTELSEAARAAGNAEGAKKAKARADALLPLPQLTIVVPDEVADTPGIEVERDGVALGKAAWGTAIPVDPGDHTVKVAAPGKAPWSAAVHVDTPSGSATLEVPPLADAARTGLGRRRVGTIVGTAGVAGLVAGGVFGAVALSKAGDARTQCAGRAGCKPTTVASENGTYTFADLSTVLFIAGGAAVAAGAVLWLTAPTDSARSSATLRLVPLAGAGAAGGLLEGTF